MAKGDETPGQARRRLIREHQGEDGGSREEIYEVVIPGVLVYLGFDNGEEYDEWDLKRVALSHAIENIGLDEHNLAPDIRLNLVAATEA
jgi:hypothetical protein